MPKFYEDPEVIVQQAWLGKWKIVSKLTGAIYHPTADIKHQMAQAWIKVRHNKRTGPQQRKIGELVLFKAFANATMNPSGEAGVAFLLLPPDAYARALVGDISYYMEHVIAEREGKADAKPSRTPPRKSNDEYL